VYLYVFGFGKDVTDVLQEGSVLMLIEWNWVQCVPAVNPGLEFVTQGE
jgi:hypothetical protein